MNRSVTGRAAPRTRAWVAAGVTAARRAAARWWTAPLLVLAIAFDDALLMPRSPGYTVLGLLDEPAHLATTATILIAVGAVAAAPAGRAGRGPASGGGFARFAGAALLAGNLIDVDHVPGALGSELLTAGTPRPYSHSILTVLVLLALTAAGTSWSGSRSGSGAGFGSWFVAVPSGAALGVAGHLLRDLATAPVALFWPLSAVGVTLPHQVYLVVLIVCALAPVALAGVKVRARGVDTAD